MFGTLHGDHLGLRHPGEVWRGDSRWQEIVELGNHDGHGPAICGPAVEVGVLCVAQRRAQQHSTGHLGEQTVPQDDVGAETPPHQPDVRQPPVGGQVDRRLEIEAFGGAGVELTLRRPCRARGPPGVETQNRQVG